MRMFTGSETWVGGRIELLVALGQSSPERQLKALQRIWSWRSLRGPYLESKVEPEYQAQVQAVLGQALYGVATLPNTSKVAFATSLVEDDDGAWLYAGVPLGSLGTAYPVGAFPFDEGFAPWQHEVYAWLFGLAQHLFSELQFERGVVGWLTTIEVDELAERRLPEKRFHGYLRAESGALCYYPPNQSGARLQ
jgi:hypothetical protein